MQASETTPEGVLPPGVIDLARALIRIPSENPPADYGPISAFIRETLSRTRAEVVIMEGEPGKTNVAALLRGEDPDGTTLLLNGHMDVVPAGDRSLWEVDPYTAEERDGEIWGRGTMDMKGSLAAQIQAFVAIANSKERLRGNLIFAATCDDETAGKMGMGYVFPTGLEAYGWPRPTFHLLGEANQLNITTAFKGRIWVEVEAIGKAAHGGAPDGGVNAIERVVTAGHALRELMSGQHRLVGQDTFNFGTIRGGEQVNVVPDLCTARFDLRFGPHRTTDDIEAGIRKAVAAAAEDATLRFKILERREPLEVAPEAPAIALLHECIAAVTGRRPEIQGTLSAGDLYYTALQGVPGVWVGPGDPALFHVINERVDKEELVQAARIYARFAHAYLGTGESDA
ncbi:MAG: M20 family metallopeptidase [Anaerolineae bacterium]